MIPNIEKLPTNLDLLLAPDVRGDKAQLRWQKKFGNKQ